jgi:hypothetical protein
MKMGRAAKATIGDLVYAILTKNPKLSDGRRCSMPITKT